MTTANLPRLIAPTDPRTFSGALLPTPFVARSTNPGRAPDSLPHWREDRRWIETPCFVSGVARPATPGPDCGATRDNAHPAVPGETGDASPPRAKRVRLPGASSASRAPVAASRRPPDAPAARPRPPWPDPREPEQPENRALREDTSVRFATSFALI